MKRATNGKGNNSARDEWQTPYWIFNPLYEQYRFEFDCCANAINTKCPQWSSDFQNEKTVDRKAWMNPPFSKAQTMFEHFFEVVEGGVAIYRCDNFETGLWQRVIFPNASWIFIPNRRVNYEGLDGDSARFPSALIGLKLPKPCCLEGTVLRPVK